jgi:molybdate transport system ATP-binding protein
MLSHDIAETIKMSDKVIVINDGKVTKSGTPLEVFSNQYATEKGKFKTPVLAIHALEDTVSVLIGTQVVQLPYSKEKIKGLAVGDEITVEVNA